MVGGEERHLVGGGGQVGVEEPGAGERAWAGGGESVVDDG